MTLAPEKHEETEHPTRWKPGQSGNPAGRPRKGSSFAEILSAIGDEDIQGMTKKEAISRRLWAEASKGEAWAVREILDRIDGRPKQVSEIDHTTNGKDIGIPVHTFVKSE